MAYQIDLSAQAEADVDAVLKWFHRSKATEAGARWYEQLLAALKTLQLRPERCSLAAESDDLGVEIRELLIGRRRYRYRVLFNISGQSVHILRIWHSARDSITRADLDA
jgi:plasmid stabilization system protein ParE